MKKIFLVLIVAGLLISGCCAVNKRAVDTNLKAWKHVGAEYRVYVEADDELDHDEKEDLLLVVDEAVLHAEEMVETVSGTEEKKEGE